MRRLVVLSALLAVCCAKATTVAPSAVPAPKPTDITYTINIPDSNVAFSLRYEFPDGIVLSPMDAQHQFDYTDAYRGSPNVYYGPTSPHCEYENTGIVVAPRVVAAMTTFTARDWPGIGLEPGVTYEWLGRFAYTMPAVDGSFGPDISGSCGTVPK